MCCYYWGVFLATGIGHLTLLTNFSKVGNLDMKVITRSFPEQRNQFDQGPTIPSVFLRFCQRRTIFFRTLYQVWVWGVATPVTCPCRVNLRARTCYKFWERACLSYLRDRGQHYSWGKGQLLCGGSLPCRHRYCAQVIC